MNIRLKKLNASKNSGKSKTIGFSYDEEQRITANNLDPVCEYVNKTRNRNKEQSLFANEVAEKKFEQYFLDHCFN